MPSFKHYVALEIARRFRAFLRLDAGLTRKEGSDPERQAEIQAQALNRARTRSRKQAAQLRELRGLLSRERRRTTVLQAELDAAGEGSAAAARSASQVKSRAGLTVLDNTFPHVISAFRIAEYNAYLERWPDAAVYSMADFRSLRETRSTGEILDEYAEVYPQLRDRVFLFDEKVLPAQSLAGSDLAYTVFLRNAFRFLDPIHESGVPFVFTLYPGGGFELDQERSDRELEAVLSSPNLRKVIVTQKVTKDYLSKKNFCGPEKVEFIYGGVFPAERLLARSVKKRYYGAGKDTFDVCFVALKYSERGEDKGYDVFVEAAKALSEKHEDVFFHVVGPFDESDVDLGGISDKIRFYGTRSTDFFPEFYSGMDIILSPNVPFVKAPGSFDGLPTGGCIEAGLCGVAVFCTDPLDQNIVFKDVEELVITPRDPEAIGRIVTRYHEDPDALYELAARGQRAFAGTFAPEAQLEPRIRILSDLLPGHTPNDVPSM